MKKIIEKSIQNLISVITKGALTEEEKSKLMEVLGTLQGMLILENLKEPKNDIPKNLFQSPKAR